MSPSLTSLLDSVPALREANLEHLHAVPWDRERMNSIEFMRAIMAMESAGEIYLEEFRGVPA